MCTIRIFSKLLLKDFYRIILRYGNITIGDVKRFNVSNVQDEEITQELFAMGMYRIN